MRLKHIGGRTYYIDDDTNCNIGLYVLNDSQCILIDAGYEQEAQALLDYLHANGLAPVVIINTHGHVDHAGADEFIKERSEATIYAPSGESWVIEKPELEMIGLTGTPSFGALNDAFLRGRHCHTDVTLQPGVVTIYSVQLNALSLSGHSIDHMGIATPDNVLFCGDAVYTHEFIKKYKLPYISDVAATLSTLEYLKDMTYAYYVPSHGTVLRDIRSAVEENVKLLKDVLGYIVENLDEPVTREELCINIMEHYHVWMSMPQHFLMMSYTSALLRYLYEGGIIEPVIENYSLKWKARV
ncbi:MBL fold metallo-hydrolase [Mahella australiensis]|uniref:Beta-lactamase n=1 Tax=Mahella australiensis (strain DSM 15567 / CIP 107919 / 50-1 BON) TaxID=697281 RepID=F3ZVB9_MAHA5|nr:MBL fold metallo-hydrolase [Mahella australiensis]AEE95269.1 beta-lactamase [Mahella australiensis 50-1 BON]